MVCDTTLRSPVCKIAPNVPGTCALHEHCADSANDVYCVGFRGGANFSVEMIPCPEFTGTSVYDLQCACRRVDVATVKNPQVSGDPETGGQVDPYEAPPPGVKPLAGDVAGPVIVHEPVSTTVLEAVPAAITVSVTDDSSVRQVALFWRPQGDAGDGYIVAMEPDDLDRSIFRGEIPASALTGNDVEYRIAAMDWAEMLNIGYLPAKVGDDYGWFAFDITHSAPVITLLTTFDPRLADDLTEDSEYTVEAHIDDPSGVAEPSVVFRNACNDQTHTVMMDLVDPAAKRYRAVIPGWNQKPLWIKFAIRARDGASDQWGWLPSAEPMWWYKRDVADTTRPTVEFARLASP